MDTRDLTITAITKEPKQYNGQLYWGVKDKDGNWLDFYDSEKPKTGFTYHVEVKSTTAANGKTYYKARRVPGADKPPPQATNGNGKAPETTAPPTDQPEPPKDNRIPLSEWCAAMKAFHAIALELEPDLTEEAEAQTAIGETHRAILVRTDRAQVRAQMVNTCLIAYSNGKIAFEVLENGGMPF